MNQIRRIATSRDDLILDARRKEAEAEADAMLEDMRAEEQEAPAAE